MEQFGAKGNGINRAFCKYTGIIAIWVLLLILMLLTLVDIKMPPDTSFQPNADAVTIIDGIYDEMTVAQVFTASTNNIASVDVMVGTYERINHFVLILEIREKSTNALLTGCEIDSSDLIDNTYQRIEFPSANVLPGEQYCLTFRTEGADSQNTIALYRTGDNTADYLGYAQLDGIAQSYSLAVKINSYKSSLATFLGAIVILLAVVIIAEIYIVVFAKRIPLEGVFSVFVFGIGTFYLIVITPLSIPDGVYHYQAAYSVSNYILLEWDEIEYGEAAHFDYSGIGESNVSSGYIRVMNEIGKENLSKEKVLIPGYRGHGYFLQHLPQAFGIALGRACGRNLITIVLMGRFCNLIFYTGCIYFAVKRIPRFKVALGLIGTMPMSLHLAASLSYDCFVNGISFFLIASILKAIYEKGKLERRDYLCILVSGMLLAPAKVIYSVILFLCVLIPSERFKSKKRKLLGVMLIFVSTALFIAVFQLGVLANMVMETVELNGAGQHNYTLSFAFQHPFQTVRIFLRTIQQLGSRWFSWMIGSSLSSLNLFVPMWIINMFALCIFLSIFSWGDRKDDLTSKHRSCFLFAFLVVLFLTMASMFLSWTSNTGQLIEGVQGRYLIPVFPLLVFAVNSKTVVLRRSIDKELIVTSVLLHGNVIISVLDYTMQH